MKKKLLSFALSGMLAFGALFSFSACKPQSGSGSGNAGGNSTGGSTNNNQTIKPGTVITDETAKSSIFSALAEADPAGLTYAGTVSLSAAQGAQTHTQTIALEGAMLLGKSVSADVSVSLEGEEGAQYLLGFLRESGAYFAAGDAEGETVDFQALKAQLKAEEEPLVLEKEDAGPLPAIFAAPAAVKLLKNTTALFDGVVTKTEGGYSLSFDLLEGAKNFLKGAEAVAGAIDEAETMTVTGLVSQKFVGDTLTNLFRGITAKELASLAELLPEELSSLLPEADDGSAKDYLLGLLRSGDFYTKVTGGEEPWSDYKTFGEVPLSKAVSFIAGEEVDLSALKLKETLSKFGEELENKLAALLIDLLSIEGEVGEENVDLSLAFSFDENKKLLGLTLDALAEGAVTPFPEQDDGGASPENGNGDPVKTAAEDATKVHIGLKMNATCTSAPQLFDLRGCKYRTESGTSEIG